MTTVEGYGGQHYEVRENYFAIGVGYVGAYARGFNEVFGNAARVAKVAKRPPRYRVGVVDEVWRTAASKRADGRVLCPKTGDELFWNPTKNRQGQWDMGHLPNKSYNQFRQRYIDGEISYEKFLDEYNNPRNYRPESMSGNRADNQIMQ